MTTGPEHNPPSPTPAHGPAVPSPAPAESAHHHEPATSPQKFPTSSPGAGQHPAHAPQFGYGGPTPHHPTGPPYPNMSLGPKPPAGGPFGPTPPYTPPFSPAPKHTTRTLVAAAAIAAVLGLGGGLIGGVISSENSGETEHKVQTQGQTINDTSDNAAINARDSVVAISAGDGGGSGVILTKDGYILTNNHVVTRARGLEVTLPNGDKVRAEVMATDPENDLALVKADADGLTPATFAENEVEVGDTVYAIGSPFGLDGTITKGIVSATDRDLEVSRDETIRQSIQTDAAINPGNSGGALVNGTGQVVGINTAIASGGSNANAGIGFAIPASTATEFANKAMDET